jgi:hypothetical protein
MPLLIQKMVTDPSYVVGVSEGTGVSEGVGGVAVGVNGVEVGGTGVAVGAGEVGVFVAADVDVLVASVPVGVLVRLLETTITTVILPPKPVPVSSASRQ